MAKIYSLSIINNSSYSGSYCVYQRSPIQNDVKKLYSLAWFAKFCHPMTSVDFCWDKDYCFAWSETEKLEPRKIFEPFEVKRSDPNDPALNTISLARSDGAYHFAPPMFRSNPGSLNIQVDGTVPDHSVSIGIGMSGRPAFATDALSNFSFSFWPNFSYWVAFGNFVAGEVLDLKKMGPTIEVVYTPNVYSRTIIYNPDNVWKIE